MMVSTEKFLEGRVAMVTGAAQGIGRAIAKSLGRAGARVAVCDVVESAPKEDTPPPAPRSLAPEAVADAGEAMYFRCDVTDREQVEATVKAVVAQFGGLDILVNNAGIAVDGLLLRTKPEDWDRVLRVNLDGAFNCARSAARHLLKAKQNGRIVNISSVVGEQGNTGQAAYSASKAALIGLTKTLAQELAGRGVTVNAVSPGFIETQMTRDHVQGERRERLLAAIPLGRIGAPEDVASAVSYLCSPSAGYITGQVIRVNGGLYM
jgi:3-oxoacyl-[acyl-carrier protein] reductase